MICWDQEKYRASQQKIVEIYWKSTFLGKFSLCKGSSELKLVIQKFA